VSAFDRRRPNRTTHLAPPVVADTLRSPGRPLPEPARREMESRLGHDFGHVRIHTDAKAAATVRAVGADAYAVGRNVAFDDGRFRPDTPDGQRLLSHELTHVLQQGSRDADGAAALPLADPAGAAEQEARHAAQGGHPFRGLAGQAPLGVARQEADAGPTGPIWPPARAEKELPLRDEDAKVTRGISTSSAEFQRDYIDNNIESAGFWDTPYASTDPKLREFWISYDDGRQLQFSLDTVPVRYEVKHFPEEGFRGARMLFKPTMYFKRGGFIYPDLLSFGSVPRLIDVATTVKANHLRREQFLEIATLTFQFAMILTAYAAPPEVPRGGGGPGRLPPRRPPGKGGGGGGETPPKPVTKPPAKSTQKGVPETGSAGSRKESVATAVERERMAPRPSLSPAQQQIADSLLREHQGLHPRVAAEAAVGGERAMGAGGRGADVALLSGGGREVSVHAGEFSARNLGRHLIEEAGQAGTTEIYLQINTRGATRTGLLGMMPQLQRGYVDLEGIFVKIFGPNGEAWWSGVFRFTGG